MSCPNPAAKRQGYTHGSVEVVISSQATLPGISGSAVDSFDCHRTAMHHTPVVFVKLQLCTDRGCK